MREVVTTEWLDASPAAVWAVLSELPAWPLWNPGVKALDGVFERGARWRMTLGTDTRRFTVGVRVVTLEPLRELAWEGGVSGVTVARHGFLLHEEDGGTRFEHYERFSGVVPHAIWPWLRPRLVPRYEATNAGLKRHVAP